MRSRCSIQFNYLINQYDMRALSAPKWLFRYLSNIILILWLPQIKVNKIKGLFRDFSRTFCSIFNHCISSKIIKPWNPTTVSILLDYTLWTNSFSLIRRKCILPYTITFVIWYSTLPGNIFKWLFSRTNIRRNVKEWQVSWISCDTFYA